MKRTIAGVCLAILAAVASIMILPAKPVNALTKKGVVYSWNEDGTATVDICWYDEENFSENVVIPEVVEGHTVTTIHDGAFSSNSGRKKLKSVKIPKTVRWIGNNAFEDCTNLSSVIIKAGCQIEKIQNQAFSGCKSLKTIRIPAGVKSIDYAAFFGSGLESVTFEPGCSLECIDKSAFHNTSSLKSLTIPASVTEIGVDAFNNSGITSIAFASDSRLQSVKDTAFESCANLKKIVFPKSVNSFGQWVIRSSGIGSISFEAGSSLTNIGDFSFTECPALKEVRIPASVESIGLQAFENDGLTSVIFEAGSGLKTIETFAFNNNSSLKSISLPDGLNEIQYGAFKGSSISAVTIPGSVTNIQDEAFCCSAQLIVHFDGDEEKWNSVTKGDTWTNTTNPVHFIVLTNLKATPDLDGGYMYACSTPGCHVRGDIIDKISRPAAYKLSKTSFIYNGSAMRPEVTEVKDEDGNTIDAACYSVSYSNNVNAGNKAAVEITFDSDKYTGSKMIYFTINKAANPLQITAKTAKIKYKKLKKKTQSLAVTKVMTLTKDLKDQKTYTLASAKKGKKSFKKYFKINNTTGKVTIKKNKKMKKGSYIVTVKVKAAGNNNYKASDVKTVKVTFKVK